MLAMTNEQIEQLSETFLKQMNSLSDVEFVKSPFAIKEMLSLKEKIFKDNEKKSDEEIKTFLKDFSEDGKNFTEYRKDIEAQLSKIMSPESLNELNSLISQALTKLEKNEYWQSMNHPNEQFDAKSVELCIPENRAGRCFRAIMDDGTNKDVVTINPIAYINYLNNCKVEDKLTVTEAFIIHELTHGDQYNRIYEKSGNIHDIPTDYMPSLNTKPFQQEQKSLPLDVLLLRDAIWEADTRSTACKCIVDKSNIDKSSKEEVIEMQLMGNQEIRNEAKENILNAKNHKEIFFEILSNYTVELKKHMYNDKAVSISFSENVTEFVKDVYDEKKYGDYDAFVQDVKAIIQATNSMQMEAENKQSNDNQNIKDVTRNETNEQSSEAIQPVNKKIEELKQRSAANNEAIENEGNNKRTMDELRGISKHPEVSHKTHTTTVNQQTLHAYREQKRYH